MEALPFMHHRVVSTEQYEKLKTNMIQPEEVAEKVVYAVKGKYKTGSSIDVY